MPEIESTETRDPAALSVAFVDRCRQEGLDVPVGSAISFLHAMGVVELAPDSLYWAGRSTLVTRREDIGAYDIAFESFWLGRGGQSAADPPPAPLGLATDEGQDGQDPVAGEDSTGLVVSYSSTEVLRHKDFAECTTEELDEARRLMAELHMRTPMRRSRRRRHSHRNGGRPDLRRTVRHALRTQGEPIRRAFTERAERPRRIVVLLDVSGSMEPYARALLRFAQVAVAGKQHVEVFAIGTRLTRLTRELADHDPDAALQRAADTVFDWSGGTRLGDGLRSFNTEWGLRGMARGAVVVILSDGWDRGEPELLADEMARLRRVAHRVVWVNPLKATRGYEPVVRGMAAALPHVDEFLEGHSLASLEELMGVLSR